MRIQADMASVLGGCNDCNRHDCLIYEVELRASAFRLCERCLVTLINTTEALVESRPKRRTRTRRRRT